MAAHDNTKPAGGSTFDLDEDLFNFPVIELGPEGLRDPVAAAAAEAEAAAKAAAAAQAAAPAAPLPSSSAAASSSTTLGAAHPTIVPVTQVAANNANKSAAASKEPVASTPAPAAEMPGGRWRLLVAALAGLFVLNGAAFFYLYRTHSAFGAGIEDLRTELGDATVRLERARNEIKENGPLSLGTSPYSVGDTVDAMERQVLATAETEILTKDFSAARRRLYRLLAQADRMPASLRADVEPRASYLIARSYYIESQSREEGSR